LAAGIAGEVPGPEGPGIIVPSLDELHVGRGARRPRHTQPFQRRKMKLACVHEGAQVRVDVNNLQNMNLLVQPGNTRSRETGEVAA
jgi:hypothetical protein